MPSPTSTTTKRAAESTMLGSTRSCVLHRRARRRTPARAGRSAARSPPRRSRGDRSRHRVHQPGGVGRDDQQRQDERSGEMRGARERRPKKANAAPTRSRHAARDGGEAQRAGGAAAHPRGAPSGRARSARAQQEHHRHRQPRRASWRGRSTGTSRSRGWPGASTRAMTIQAKRSTTTKQRRRDHQLLHAARPGKAAEVPIAATAKSSSPLTRRKNRLRPGRSASRGESCRHSLRGAQ